jgi:UDP-glucuronate 4-epimerase
MEARLLLTGAAGFIGSHAAQAFLAQGAQVVGVDNLNDYYSRTLKQDRIARLQSHPRFTFVEADLGQQGALRDRFPNDAFTHILHLAAQAGVRHSIERPFAYEHSNLAGHLEVLEFARHATGLRHLVYASSSSVYGDRTNGPFREDDRCDAPASLYAATKKACELMSETYARLYGLPQTGLRFFTVYGRWGRPDMAYWMFTQKVLTGQPIDVFGGGVLERDFTHIDDIVAVLPTILQNPPTTSPPHGVYNLGNSKPTSVNSLIDTIEKAAGMRARRNDVSKQPGDVDSTFADISRAQRDFGYRPSRNVEDGISDFVGWYKTYAGG